MGGKTQGARGYSRGKVKRKAVLEIPGCDDYNREDFYCWIIPVRARTGGNEY